MRGLFHLRWRRPQLLRHLENNQITIDEIFTQNLRPKHYPFFSFFFPLFTSNFFNLQLLHSSLRTRARQPLLQPAGKKTPVIVFLSKLSRYRKMSSLHVRLPEAPSSSGKEENPGVSLTRGSKSVVTHVCAHLYFYVVYMTHTCC